MLKTATTIWESVRRTTPGSTGSPAPPAHSPNAIRVALRMVYWATVLFPCAAAAAASSSSSSSASSPSPDGDEWPGSVVAMVSEVSPVSPRFVGRSPTAITPLPFLWFPDVRDVTTSPRRPTPTVRTNGSKNRKRKTKKPKNKRNRNGKKKKTVLKNKTIVRLESTPRTEDSPPPSSSPPPPPPPTSTVRAQGVVPRCAAANGRFIDLSVGLVKSIEFQLAVTVVFALLSAVIIAVYRCWTRRLAPFDVLV